MGFSPSLVDKVTQENGGLITKFLTNKQTCFFLFSLLKIEVNHLFILLTEVMIKKISTCLGEDDAGLLLENLITLTVSISAEKCLFYLFLNLKADK